MADVASFDLIFISETWFDNASTTCIPYFTLFRKDRTTYAGGVAIYARNGLVIKNAVYPELTAVHAEHIWLELLFEKSSTLLISCVYTPHTSSVAANSEIISPIRFSKQLLDERRISGLLIAGDFN